MSSDLVTARDLLSNKFVVTVHKAILNRFYRAIRQRQIVLSQYGIPPEVVSLVSSQQQQQPSTTSSDAAAATSVVATTVDYESLAFCFYHFISFKYWEEDRSQKVWEAVKADFEDHLEKHVTCYQSKLAVCLNSLVLRVTIGYRVQHSIVWCVPAGALPKLTPSPSAAKPHRRIIAVSQNKFSTGEDLHGSWHVYVDLRRPAYATLSQFSSAQMADVVEIVVSIKPRHDLGQMVARVFAKLPPEKRIADDEDTVDEDDEVVCDNNLVQSAETQQLLSEEKLFGAPARFSGVEVLEGAADPVPLPRDPSGFRCPPDVVEGPEIPPYAPYTPLSPSVVAINKDGSISHDATSSYSSAYELSVVGLRTNQSLGSTRKCPVGKDSSTIGVDMPWYCQYFDVTVRLLNKTNETLVFNPPTNLRITSKNNNNVVPEEHSSSSPEAVTSFSIRGAKWDSSRDGVLVVEARDCITSIIRCEVEVLNRKSGSDNFERSLLDPVVFPQPAVLHLDVAEAHTGEAAQVTVEQYNPDRELDTKQSLMENWKVKVHNVLLFVFADDCDAFRRYSAAVLLNDDNELVIARRNQTIPLNLLRLNAVAYESLMSGKDHVKLDGISDEHCVVNLLVSTDGYPPMVYGIQIEMTTPTSKTIRSCHIRLGGDNWIAKPKNASSVNSAVSSLSSGARSNNTTNGVDHGGLLSVTSNSSARQAIVNSGSSGTFEPQRLSAAENGGEASNVSPAQDGNHHRDPAALSSSSSRDDSMGTPSLSASVGYKIMYDSPLGSGSFGSVYRAFDLVNGKSVAVKETHILPVNRRCLSTTTTSSTSSRPHRKEFDVLVQLDHPNIVKVYDMDMVDNGSIFRVFMEWVPGGSISSLMKQHGNFRLHENVLRNYARGALLGLAYLHQHSILHLDIKPGNILLTQDGSVKVADFGTTMFLTQGVTSVSTQHVVGTPAYMAPEIISSGKYSRASDIWAWACCLIEMSTGQVPWSHLPPDVFESALPLMFHIGSAKPPNHCPHMPRHLSQELQDILSACFSPSPSLRPSAEALLATDYFARATLPLDVEQLEAFYDVAHAQQQQEGGHGVANDATTSTSVTSAAWPSSRDSCTGTAASTASSEGTHVLV